MQKRKHSNYGVIVVAMMLLVAAMAGCKKDDTVTNPPATGGTGGNTNTVSMANTAFNPVSLTVTAGTTVTWKNDDAMTHTVTSGVPGAPDGLFDSGNMNNGATFQHTFANKGTFPYYCVIHANTMKGTVIVQ